MEFIGPREELTEVVGIHRTEMDVVLHLTHLAILGQPSDTRIQWRVFKGVVPFQLAPFVNSCRVHLPSSFDARSSTTQGRRRPSLLYLESPPIYVRAP